MATNRKKPNKKKGDMAQPKKVSRAVGIKRSGKAKEGKNNFRAIFVESLVDKKKHLEQLLEGLIGTQKEYNNELTASEFIDELDDAQREISSQNHYVLIERKIKELQKIEYLLNTLPKKGEFGICEECGGPIPKERLLIIPDATLCVPCQQELEKLVNRQEFSSRASINMGGGKEMNWIDSGEDERSSQKEISSMDQFSLSDILGTEIEDATLETE